MMNRSNATCLLALVCLAALLASCTMSHDGQAPARRFTIDVLNRHTPVKNQGRGSTCWIYAMLATIETDRIMQGDSVNLSPDYMARRLLERQYSRHVLSGGTSYVGCRGVMPDLLWLLGECGTMPFNSYSTVRVSDAPAADMSLLARKTKAMARKAVNLSAEPQRFERLLTTMLDESLGHLPPHVFMLGAEYTPEEFGRSVCRPSDYAVVTSFTHRPYNRLIDLELPDNRRHNLFLNVPLDSLLAATVGAVVRGCGVCWEGDVSEPGFSFSRGVAVADGCPRPTPQLRQRLFETRKTTDDHCMEIVGLAHDDDNRRYFILKNSWGTGNPYKGLMYMSEDYFLLKTIAVCYRSNSPYSTCEKRDE